MSPFERVSGRLYRNWQDPDGGQGGWHSWQPDFQGAPEMFFITTADRSGPYRFRMQAFGLTTDGTLLHNWMDSDGTWHDWSRNWKGLYAPKFRLVEAKNGNTGHLEVFGIGRDDGGLLYHNWQNSDDEQFHEWVPAFQRASQMQFITAAIGATGHLEVFGVGIDGTLYHNWLDDDGSWHEWVGGFQGAPYVTVVEAVIGSSGNLEVFAVGAANGTLYHNWLDGDGKWHEWVPNFQRAPSVQSVTAALGGPNLHVFAITADSVLSHLMQNSDGTWTEWDEDFLGGSPRVLFAKVVRGPWAQLNLFAIRNDHVLLRTWQGDSEGPYMGWHPWEPHFYGAPLAGFVAAALGGGSAIKVSDHLEVFLISPPVDR